ncbi:4-hydroxybenzoate octaprenyltransferase [Aliikangiella marina]|uniref:4-hydroxybenzoate octaprenyltransferase n=2 Tax=Aliikangiella marina TaxID=1712262 RepID=A0A545TAA2_9GAMM|nr:4-hydroxybenzoate octaprenyltransferase [Aliikangiella marina]
MAELYSWVKSIKLSPTWQYRLRQYGLLMRVDKPIGIFLLLWPTLWALWLAADGTPSLSLIVIFSIGVFLTRSAGCVINDFADRNFDGKVERTKSRPLATGVVTEKEALALFVILSLIAFGLVLMLNSLSIILSVIAIAIAMAYPFMKRVTYFPQVVLGAAFSMSIPMAFAATNNEIPESAWLLYIANLLWVLAYDTLYGMVDKKDDLKVGIKSTAILFGEADLQIIATIQGFFLFGMLLVGGRFELNYWYYISLLVATGLIVWQLYHCRKRQRENCFTAFLNNNWVGLVIFCGILLAKSS